MNMSIKKREIRAYEKWGQRGTMTPGPMGFRGPNMDPVGFRGPSIGPIIKGKRRGNQKNSNCRPTSRKKGDLKFAELFYYGLVYKIGIAVKLKIFKNRSSLPNTLHEQKNYVFSLFLT